MKGGPAPSPWPQAALCPDSRLEGSAGELVLGLASFVLPTAGLMLPSACDTAAGTPREEPGAWCVSLRVLLAVL